MSRTRNIRPAARVVALFLATLLCFSITSDAYGLDPCPHHGVPEHGSSHAAMAPMAGMAHHSSHHSDSHDKDAHGICTCMGACSTAAAVPVPAAHELDVATVTALAPDYAATADVAYNSFHLQYLPYGIAPPVAR